MAGNQSYVHRYREVAVKTANPLQLIVMLYDAAICSLREARGHIDRKNIAGRSRSLNKCVSIISELQSCLNLKAGGDIAASLDRLYDYMKRRIFAANVEQSVQPLVEIETLLENLRSAWGEIAGQTSGASVPPAAQEKQGRQMLGASTSPASMQTKSLNISI
ncbi:MAG: flagellar export chaperone FliS [Acidobacteria bacterium]|nr:flagellar export chaperone FliS [Acidobacteriota bacterium]